MKGVLKVSSQRILVENLWSTMRDGARLAALVYRPDCDGRFPVLLARTPYGKENTMPSFCIASAQRGYVVIVQDTRGCGASESVHYPMRDEFNDGYDSVEWAARLPWANGKVGMFGGSYVGWTQWTAAYMRPPSLKAIFPMVTFTDIYRHTQYPGGAFALGSSLSWGLGHLAGTAIRRTQPANEKQSPLFKAWLDAMDRMSSRELFYTLPLEAMPLLGDKALVPGYHNWLEHRIKDDYWDALDILSQIDRIQVPAYHLGCWYDIFCGPTLETYCQMHSKGENNLPHKGQKLLMGPWTHGDRTGMAGEVFFGTRASEAIAGLSDMMWRWFDYWLKGMDTGIMDEPPVRIFVMGINRWRDENEWPLARTVYRRWYLHSDGKANTLHGTGTLSPRTPGDEPPDTFVYDPADPVPTRGGGLCCSAAALPSGAYDQRPVEARQDVLVYTSTPLEEDLEITGPLKVVLWASSSAVDTDWTAKLVDVAPDGYARNLADGIIRARLRDPRKEQLLEPHAVVRYVIDLGGTSNVFLAGHAIRVEISSSNFPKFDRNPNTGRPATAPNDIRIAHQTILHDREHPSHILLPEIPPS